MTLASGSSTSAKRANGGLEVGHQPEQVALGHRVERVPAASPERDRLEQDLVVRRPVRIGVAIDERNVIRSAPAKKGVVVEKSGEIRRRAGPA